MQERRTSRRAGLLFGVLLLALLVFVLHALAVRPYLWPAGAGVTVSADVVFGPLAEPRAVPRIRPPELSDTTVAAVTAIAPGSAAAMAGLDPGTIVSPPLDPASALRVWRDAYRRGPMAGLELTDARTGRTVQLAPEPVWRVDVSRRESWLRQHLPALLQMAAFLVGAAVLVSLGSRGTTATLMTLALVFTSLANAGPLLGAEFLVPYLGAVLVIFGWATTAISFPVIGLAVLHFPTRARLLEGHWWVVPLVCVLPLPLLVVSLTAAAFLLGVDAALGPLTWFATNPWVYDTSFAVALAANVAIVIEGVHRYRTVVDPTERRRIQIVVYTGVPAVFAYAIKTGVPLVTTLAGHPVDVPWLLEGVLQAIILLPALSLPYAVAVKHVFSPRTVLRSSVQYALARRTLSVLVVLPLAALLVSLVRERDRPLADIVLGQPLFYAFSLGLVALGFRYRDQAQRAIDRRFFRAEYDAREILLALANRVPLQHDPANVVSMVVKSIDEALHPDAVAILAGEDARLEVLVAVRTTVTPLPRDSGLVTLLQWSEEPLEVFLDDERSSAARLPAPDRTWLASCGVTLLVPIFTGTAAPVPATGAASGTGGRTLLGVVALGRKQSEEPYTAEDRRLLSGIATQMGVGLDLSRLRRRASSVDASSQTPTLMPTMIATTGVLAPALVACPSCHRCYDGATVTAADRVARCPEDGAVLQPVIGMPVVVDGKYRVEALVGRGGMGAVFRARDLRLDRDVALKVVRTDRINDAESRARFHREAQIVARLQHPAIVTIFDFGSLPGGASFLVMEYVRGEDLRHVLRREGTLALDRAVALLSGIAGGVDAAHSAGVLHRDLKPENILLPEAATVPKVLDFGVAKLTDPGGSSPFATQGATVIGTPAYMAPEQLRGEALDGRADVYSLAVIAYEALTGRLPFGAGSFIEIAVRQREGADAVPGDGLPPAVAGAVKRGLSLAREARPATATAFAEELSASVR
jgi:eukaryotic-like serine/threonine-protein kinase